jgi:hypothetical protein
MNEQIELNEHHRRRLLVSCQYVDRLLADIEAVMAADISLSPFPKYVQDMTTAEKQLVSQRVAALRAQLVVLLKTRNTTIPGPTVSSRHSILTSLGYIDIAVEELKPRYLGGYGPVPTAVAPELNRSVEEVQEIVREAISALKEAIRSEQASPETGAP